MSIPSIPGQAVKPCGRLLSLAELAIVLEELDRVVGELQESLEELALPFDGASHFAAHDAIAAARHP